MNTVLTLEALEQAINTRPQNPDTKIPVSRKVAEECPREYLPYITVSEYIEQQTILKPWIHSSLHLPKC